MSIKYPMTKKFLQKEYLDNKRTTTEIAKEINCSKPTICAYLRKFKLKIRSNSEAHIKYNFITKKFLITEYITNEKSQAQIAKSIGCSQKTLGDYLRKFSIKINGFGRSRYGKRNSNYIDGRTKKQHYCIDCGNKTCYDTWKCGTKRCRKCAGIKELGELNHRWIDGRSYEPYPQEFTPKLKLKIRKRDDFTCQECGMIEEEHLIVYGRVLEIHHIDYNKKNCNEENLLSLCKQCNLRVNHNRRYWEYYFRKKIYVKI